MGNQSLVRLLRGVIASALLLPLLANMAIAAPTLSVSNLGPNLSGNLEWLVEVAPDASLFSSTDLGLGGSLQIEMALEVIDSDLLGVTVNSTDWPLDTSGENPFSKTVTTGVDLDLNNDTVFASLLSVFLTVDTAVELMTIETSGTDCTTLSWGGYTLLQGTVNEYKSSVIAQAGQNFAGYQGILTEPDYDGDFDQDCDVDGADMLEWQQHLGTSYIPADLVDWQTNYGAKAPLEAVLSAVPEPTSIVLLLLGLLSPVAYRAIS